MPILDNVRRAAIWGFGREGQAVYAFLRTEYPAVAVTLLNDASLADTPDVPLLTGEAATAALCDGRFDIVIKSPGISPYRPEVAVAKDKGVRFTTATSLWFEQNKGARILAVSGTKGKSSTARMLQHLLMKAGLDVRMYGNVGIAVLGQPPGRDGTVLELSSYQIADLATGPGGGPEVAVLTNLYPEHAPWHHGAENYFRDKLRLFDLDPTTKRVCNYDCERLRTRLSGRNDLIWFNQATGFAARGESLSYAGAPVDCTGFPLKGEHNYANLAAACAAADAFGVTAVRARADLSDFHQLAHRQEEFSAHGILCVNDSLCTVPEATIAALKTYRQPSVLILGGTDRGQDYAGLVAYLGQTKVKTVLLLPETGARILKELQAACRHFDYFSVPDMETAVAEGFKRLKTGDAFLLSPAAPSFGQFRNYEDRGNRFRQLCQAPSPGGK